MLWSQNKEHVTITIDLRDIQNEKIEFESGSKLNIYFNVDEKKYEEHLELSHEYDNEKSKYNKTGFHLTIDLTKKGTDSWSKLTKNDKAHNLKYNWNEFEDSDAEPEEDNGMPGGMPGMPGGMPGMEGMNMDMLKNMDFSKMGGMPGMPGGMPNMPPNMPGADESDSDDEADDLDKEEKV